MTIDLAAYRAEFPITERYAFLSHAAVSPLSRRVQAAVQTYLDHAAREPFLAVFPHVLAQFAELKQRLARLINAASPDEIVFMPNTAAGINTAAVSLPLRPGDNVLVLDGDYPANIYPWQQLAYRGVLVKVVPQHKGGLDIDVLVRRIDHRTRVIALSSAMFATGFRNDLAAVGQLCHERGIYFVVDAIQTLGAFPLDVQAWHIDMLACGSQKWLLSTPGSGFLYVRRDLIRDLVPGAYVGAASSVSGQNYLDYNLTLPETAERFTLGTPNVANNLALLAAVKMLQEVGIEQIERQINTLVAALIDDLRERGYQLAADTAPEHRSGIVVALVDNPNAVAHRLNEAGIVVTPRGAGVRIAPHFYNTLDEVLRVGEALDAATRP
ncbi:aminotransferase class V-fold PLP-dependent enzyme [Chloroflexus sp.]|uniref:aminotransferase class V-fold PLP-dependent enzyme n=1 Tax=Chloroflexus sp. TaxID=1904827 RepID=UPI00298ED306|nr:aminotransferase class V-fold PLP-dependent enzyme [Chloroflexus sp.]MCS6887037.1 aminotransferase class V-fold PLP-dependent enzyme [Chloroflexus sp.]MDW8405698.1 aminotransferase class V-fold PLP-dependent enzyme [Chloroflexus sp.]